jgi:carbamate kinase
MNHETRMRPIAVIAIGGNALVPDNAGNSMMAQQKIARMVATHVVDMVEEGWHVVLTHGNGPQVGTILRRSELTANDLPVTPVDFAVGDTQGEIGYLLQNALGNELTHRGRPMQVVTVVTQTVVDPADPAFAHPDKPIGQFMTAGQAARLAEAEGWTVREDAGRGWRRVIASPRPLRIVEVDTIAGLLDDGALVIACGGGGVPVAVGPHGLHGVEAVIDKDRASALLARSLQADLLLIPTGVERVALRFGLPGQCWLDNLDAASARRYLEQGHFGAGSMGPKVQAILDYLAACPKGLGLITSLDGMRRALRGETGTRITAAEGVAH